MALFLLGNSSHAADVLELGAHLPTEKTRTTDEQKSNPDLSAARDRKKSRAAEVIGEQPWADVASSFRLFQTNWGYSQATLGPGEHLGFLWVNTSSKQAG